MQNRREIIATMFSIDDYPDFDFLTWQAKGLRCLCVGGCGLCLGAEKLKARKMLEMAVER